MDEVEQDPYGAFVQRWECEPPQPGVSFRVLDQEWRDDYNVRVIRRIELV